LLDQVLVTAFTVPQHGLGVWKIVDKDEIAKVQIQSAANGL